MDTSLDHSVGAGLVYRPDEAPLPDWLTVPDPAPIKPSSQGKALVLLQFETAFPRVLELLYSGYTLDNAIKEMPYPIDLGAFTRWIKKDTQRNELYKEAKEIRTEAWSGEIIKHAKADDTAEDVQRSRLIVDTYKWLMGADNRKTYGDVKSIELGGQISITAALAQAQQRVIEAEVIEATDPLPRLEN